MVLCPIPTFMQASTRRPSISFCFIEALVSPNDNTECIAVARQVRRMTTQDV